MAMLDRRLFLSGAAALSLSACGGDLLGPPEAGPIYPVRPSFAPSSGPKVNWALAILRPDLPGGLDTDRIALIQANGTMEYYANSTYPDRLNAIIQRALVDGFQASGRIDAVAREQEALHADYNLFVAVKDFQANYSVQDGVPEVAVVLNAKLTTAHGRKIIGNFTASKTVNAGVNSTGAVTQALTQGLTQAVTDIVNWTLVTAPALVPGQSPETATGKPAEQLLRDVTRGSETMRANPK